MKNNLLKKGTEIDVTIDSLVTYGGSGVSKYFDGIVILLKNVIPGQISKKDNLNYDEQINQKYIQTLEALNHIGQIKKLKLLIK